MRKIFKWYNDNGFLTIAVSFVLFMFISIVFKHTPITNTIGLILILQVLFAVSVAAPLYRLFYVENHRIIPKGRHYPERIFWPPVLKKNKELLFNIEFTKSCIYEPKYGKSKLFGLSFSILPRIRTRKTCNKNGYRKDISILNLCIIFPHHWNSVRIAWKPVNEIIILYTYIYKRGVLKTNMVGKVFDMSDVQQIDFIVKKGNVHVSVNFSDYEQIDCNAKFCWYYIGLFFGGKYKAPHDIHLGMERFFD